MTASFVNLAFVNGYIERWRRVIGQTDDLIASRDFGRRN
jgi:hypothetical protein